jgi:single-strand selective monofunctional uracil DNA glycosylase
MPTIADRLLRAADELSRSLAGLELPPGATHVYNPLEYARPMYEAYLRTYGNDRKRVLFLGMNPGPFGMAQTGVPFGEVEAVRDYLKLSAPVARPRNEHPKRLIAGLACKRSEVSGKRLWGLFASRFPDPAAFFAQHFVVNYCPLVYMEESGCNLTPDKLPRALGERIETVCDKHLAVLLDQFEPQWVIGVGQFASERAQAVLGKRKLSIGTIPHPSPANPAANKNWGGQALTDLVKLGVWAAGAARA